MQWAGAELAEIETWDAMTKGHPFGCLRIPRAAHLAGLNPRGQLQKVIPYEIRIVNYK